MTYFHALPADYRYMSPIEFSRCKDCECAHDDHDETGQCGCCDCGWIKDVKGAFIDQYPQLGSEN